MEHLTLSTKTVEEVLNYLICRPYREVIQIINLLQADISKLNTPDKTNKEDNQREKPLDVEYL